MAQKWALGEMTLEQSFDMMDTYYDSGGLSRHYKALLEDFLNPYTQETLLTRLITTMYESNSGQLHFRVGANLFRDVRTAKRRSGLGTGLNGEVFNVIPCLRIPCSDIT